MKILHLVSQDTGGAGRAALRLHNALLESSNNKDEIIESIVFVQNKNTDTKNVMRISKTKTQKILEKIRPALCQIPLLFYPKRKKDIFSIDWVHNNQLIKTINSLKPDIVHLHWINNGFLNIKDLKKIKAPLLWSLHDANPYTGGCHVIEPSCKKEKFHCQKCPLLKSNFKFDMSFFTFRQKKKTYAKLDLTINGLSRWIANCARESALLKDKKIVNIPNPINTDLYSPLDKNIARKLLKINHQKKIIAFGAINATTLDRKGYPEFKKALRFLKNKSNIEILIFGASGNENGEIEYIEGIQTYYLGHLHDDISLQLVYNAADILVMPSLSENLSNTIVESLSCATPVVAFDIGGNSDIIEHKINGYLATPFDPMKLAKGIEWILSLDELNYQNLCTNGRKKIQDTFEQHLIIQNYIYLYKEIHDSHKITFQDS
ncbi:glycosyltransferase family 4 protein [Helicobacter sp. 13S00477-4]|uniref:glycosyltransferase family 4 protein n=1 Tax=Helicobacter sp. 13S00477-4 TaxID=1905759 RepID=UPI000BA6AD12|nr:glycosyltransferase family 4 protein [Helicobacter sp. 13S00477-4]PAF51941.1 hypothetical protein BKH44_04575 [Helicobacter sp. 13S00477-4]